MAKRQKHVHIEPSTDSHIIYTDLDRDQITVIDGVRSVYPFSDDGCYAVYTDPRYDQLEVMEEIANKAKALYDERLAFILAYVPYDELEVLGWDDAYRLACERDADAAQQLAMSAESVE